MQSFWCAGLKLLLDENMSPKLVDKLRKLGFDVVHIREISLGLKNYEIAEFSAKEQRVIVTHDTTFIASSSTFGVKPFAVIIIRIDPRKHDIIVKRIAEVLKSTNISGKVVWLYEDTHVEFAIK